MTFRRVVELVFGLASVAFGLFNKEFTPIGLTTLLIWGKDKNARIPRLVAGPFYVVLGLLMIYISLTGK